MGDLTAFLLGLIPSIITGMMMFYMQRAQKRRDTRAELRAIARKKESLLSLNLTMANAKMSYACAIAIKRGEPNGEVEEGINAYQSAKAEYYSFLNEQANEHLQK